MINISRFSSISVFGPIFIPLIQLPITQSATNNTAKEFHITSAREMLDMTSYKMHEVADTVHEEQIL